MRRVLAALLVLLASALVLAACATRPPEGGPAGVVQRVLELRRSRSADASAYAPFFSSPDVARQLAADAASGSVSPIPEWDRPYVSAQASSSADVVVVWRPSAKHKGWPKATVFKLERPKRDWRIVDASQVPTAVPKPANP